LRVAAALLASVAACTEPRIIERSKRACGNGLDDDGNGLIDCKDPSCVDSGACEVTANQCGDDLDQDEDGKTDCEDPDCVERGFCAPGESVCSLYPQRGCVAGMACYAAVANTFVGDRCALPGSTPELQRCERGEQCEPGYDCLSACQRLCTLSEQCLRGEYCAVPFAGRPGVCLTSCLPQIPLTGCGALTCVSTHHYMQRFGSNPTLGVCSFIPPWTGLAERDQPCDDPPSREDLVRMCKPNLACVRVSGFLRCVDTCALFESGEAAFPCPRKDDACVLAFPDDARSVRSGFPYVPGYCRPR
jgi:hypothetical protein